MQVGETLWHPKFGDVEILQSPLVSSLVEVQAEATHHIFWVPKKALTELTGDGPETDFVRQLMSTHRYSLRPTAFNKSEADFAQMMYEEWCGERFDDDCVAWQRVTGSKRVTPGCIVGGWRLYYPIEGAPPAPFRIVTPRMIDLSKSATGRAEFEHGIIRHDASRIEVNFRTIISRLVRAGLRARARYGED